MKQRRDSTSMMKICSKDALIEGKLIRIARLDAEGYDFLDDPQEALRTLRQSRCSADLFTFTQKLTEGEPKYSFPMEWENLAALRVTTYDYWFKDQIDYRARNKVRKAAKSGVVVREVPYDDDFVSGISAIYDESPVRQGKPFWHYRKGLEVVRQMNGTFHERSIYIGAYLDGGMIGFIKLVTSEDGTQAGLMQIISMICHRDVAPTNALIAQAVRSCADRKIDYLWYANFSYGKKQEDSLADFKRYNGFERVDVPRYYVPLTIAGRVALRFGLHHQSVVDLIPESLASGLREIRKRWYARRHPAIEKSKLQSGAKNLQSLRD
jgi:hypothetical protein